MSSTNAVGEDSYECPLCAEKMPLKDRDKHQSFFCIVLIERNSPFSSYVEVTKKTHHKKCNCKFCPQSEICLTCKNKFPKDKISEHKNRCGRFMVPCQLCNEMIDSACVAIHLNYCPALISDKITMQRTMTDEGKAEEKNVISSEDSVKEDNATPSESLRDLQKGMESLLISGENSDVTIKVQGKEFPAHRCILGMRSAVFQSMFKHDMEEKKTGVIDIDDCDPEIFPDFLTHLYTGRTSHVTSENVFALYSVSDKYDFGYLKEACLAFMKMNLTCENFCPTLSLALQHDEKELVSSAVEFFCGSAEKIIETKEWQIFLANNSTAGNELFRAAFKTRKPI